MPENKAPTNEPESNAPKPSPSAAKPDESRPAMPYYTPQGRTDGETAKGGAPPEANPLDAVRDRIDP